MRLDHLGTFLLGIHLKAVPFFSITRFHFYFISLCQGHFEHPVFTFCRVLALFAHMAMHMVIEHFLSQFDFSFSLRTLCT